MATFSATNPVDVLSSSIAAAAAAQQQQQQFERSANIGASTTTTTTTYLVPSTTAPLQLESFPNATNFLTTNPVQQQQQQHNHHHHHHQHNNQNHNHHHQQQQQNNSSTSTSSYTFVQIKREPCQVSEITSNCHQQQQHTQNQQNHHNQQQHQHTTVSTTTSAGAATLTTTTGSSTTQHQQHHSVGTVSSTSKTMSSSTLTTLVKIEASSPKVQEIMDKTTTTATSASITATSNSVPIGIAVARKRQQETSSANTLPPLCNSTSLPLQQPLNKDLNCIGIRVSDLGAVSTGCGNFYFTGGGDLMTSSATAEDFALSAAGVQSVNRASSTFWQYPNALPIESVISMSPATVGLQYSREASRGQVVLLPATAAALGISNFPIYTPTDPFQQAAAAALVWPSYIPQGTSSAAAAAAALQPTPNFIFPSMSSHSTLQAPQPYATSLQLFGSNYLTAAAAAAAAAAATSTLCQHNQQTNTSATNSINLSVGANGVGAASSSTMCSSSSRFLSIASTAVPSELGKQAHTQGKTAAVAHQQTAQSTLSLPPPPPPPPTSLIMPPSTMKIEEWNATEYMTAAGKTTTLAHQQNSLIASSGGQLPAALTHPLALNFETRDKTTTTTTTTNLLDLHGATQALNLMRLPTPPTSATMESAAAAAATVPQLQQQLLFQAANSTTPTLLNLSTTMPRATSTNGNYMSNGTPPIGPPTPIADDMALNFKQMPMDATPPQIVVGVPRVLPINAVNSQPGPAPQMQDVNIQTDTPLCSEDENSSCTMSMQQQSVAPGTPPPEPASTTVDEDESMDQDLQDAQQPLELTKHSNLNEVEAPAKVLSSECHNNNIHNIVQSTTVTEHHVEMLPTQVVPPTIVPQQEPVKMSFSTSNLTQQTNSEDLTGLELLSNISTSTLAKSDINANEPPKLLRVKQEPVDIVVEESQETSENSMYEPTSSTTTTTATLLTSSVGNPNENMPSVQTEQQHQEQQQQQQSQTVVEPLGGLNLLCALAEQRIQEEVQSSGGSGLFCTSSGNEAQRTFSFPSTANATAEAELAQDQSKPMDIEQSSFPSMEGIELPSTSGVAVNESVKRKKHKHSKSSKSSSSSGKKSQRCSKKSKKRNSKEKRKHKQQTPATADELDFEDEQLQEELRSAFKSVDPKFQNTNKWPNPQEIFNIMEQNMRMRLADITRQYRKKKRKLDEIAKNKKKKKCSKLAAQREREREREQQLQLQQTTPSLSLSGSSVLALHANGNSALSVAANSQPLLCDYKFSKFANVSATGVGVGSGATKHSSYLQPSSFMRFAEKSHTSFPPADCDMSNDQDKETTSGAISTGIFKPVRLEPSALAAADRQRNAAAIRLSHKHASSENTSHIIVSKERKLMSCSGSSNSRHSSGDDADDASNIAMPSTSPKKASSATSQSSPVNSTDRELLLTNEHLYRKETRVLTDMGGLFYAGIMKPLQPPDIYAITLDGERGNKSHIMSREEIFKDTILEVAPKSVESLPVGTRLCAYWSQQYRCLYPGRVIESESSEDGALPNDFVSVEFDDGDSGRIRLQNIRLLLSDYPIAEYNDNPLYSLGKQKKNRSQTGSNNNINESHKSQMELQTSHSITEEQYNKMSSLGIEMYAKRTEKKRLKRSQKKKTQAEKHSAAAAAASANAAAYTTATTTTTTSTILSNGHQMLKTCTTTATMAIGEAEQAADTQRKHHKHKKRKKHKKHHHRKNNMDAAENGKCYMIAPVPLPYKRELSLEDEPNNNEDDDDVAQYATTEYNNNTERHAGILDKRAHVAQSAGSALTAITTPTGATIKLETSMNGGGAGGLMGCIGGNDVKVKTENLDLEEETTSNLMSEISDEAKSADDVVEHNNSKGSSKIAAFLPERQLWGWFGTAYRKAGVKGRARKQFYKTIKRGKETITVGECAVFLSTGRPDRPYIGRIESMWETTSGNKVVRVRWFYHPEETTGCPSLKYPGALFESPHEDENDVQTISHRCEVLEFLNYFGKFGADSKQYQSIYDNNDTYYLAGYYNPRLKVLKLQDDIPTLEELNNTTTNNINHNNNNINNNNCNDYDNEIDNNV